MRTILDELVNVFLAGARTGLRAFAFVAGVLLALKWVLHVR